MMETKRKRVLIVTTRAIIIDDTLKNIRKDIQRQMQGGGIVLPAGFTYSVEEIDEVYVKESGKPIALE